MRKFLVAYTTNSGTTKEVAKAIGEEMGRGGDEVDVRRLEEVTNLDPYAAVVIGAPMIMGWHRAALRFAKMNQQALSKVPVAYFMTAMRLTKTEEKEVDGIPIVVDPLIAKPAKNPARLSFKERYTLATNYLRPILKQAQSVRPISVGMFGGRLEYYRLKWYQVLFVMAVIQVQPGGSHNWPFIQQWAANLRLLLEKV
jgi:menaquinone-dependent protoporphyrinogen IX oxidase